MTLAGCKIFNDMERCTASLQLRSFYIVHQITSDSVVKELQMPKRGQQRRRQEFFSRGLGPFPLPSLSSLPSLSPPLPFPSLPLLYPFPPFPSPQNDEADRSSAPPLPSPPLLSPPLPSCPQPKSILVHFSVKIWHLVATILMIFLRINWSNFMHFKK